MSALSKTDAGLMVGISRTANALQHEVSLLCAGYGVTQTQFAVLEALSTKGSLLVGEIQRLILSTPGNVPFVIGNLVKKGFVTRESTDSDRRCSRVSLTARGLEKIRDILPAHDALLTEKLGVLTPSEKDALLKLLQKFRDKPKGEEKP